jgi:hypothetical protein
MMITADSEVEDAFDEYLRLRRRFSSSCQLIDTEVVDLIKTRSNVIRQLNRQAYIEDGVELRSAPDGNEQHVGHQPPSCVNLEPLLTSVPGVGDGNQTQSEQSCSWSYGPNTFTGVGKAHPRD